MLQYIYRDNIFWEQSVVVGTGTGSSGGNRQQWWEKGISAWWALIAQVGQLIVGQ